MRVALGDALGVALDVADWDAMLLAMPVGGSNQADLARQMILNRTGLVRADPLKNETGNTA